MGRCILLVALMVSLAGCVKKECVVTTNTYSTIINCPSGFTESPPATLTGAR